MAAIADLSDLVNRLTGGNSGTPEHIFFTKDARVAGAVAAAAIVGRWISLWEYEGSPSHGAVPTTGAIPVNTTAGGLQQTDPGGGRQKWCTGMVVAPSQPGTLTMLDRLFHIGSLSGTTLTAQTVQGDPASPALTRYTDGVGVKAYVEIYTQIGATPTTLTMAYYNQAGASKTSPAVAIGATGLREANRIIPIPLAAGDTGIQSVTSVTLAGSTGTAGNFGVVIARPLVTVCCLGNQAGVRDLIAGLPSIVEIKTDACLWMMWVSTIVAAPQNFVGSVHFVEK